MMSSCFFAKRIRPHPPPFSYPDTLISPPHPLSGNSRASAHVDLLKVHPVFGKSGASMSATYAALISTGVCLCAAALEGVCAGKNVKAYFAKLKWPRYAAPLWVWYIIGAAYYAI